MRKVREYVRIDACFTSASHKFSRVVIVITVLVLWIWAVCVCISVLSKDIKDNGAKLTDTSKLEAVYISIYGTYNLYLVVMHYLDGLEF